MTMSKLRLLSVLILVLSHFSFSQFTLNRSWIPLGPDTIPNSPSNQSARGVGPIEFIRTTPLQKGLLLAGSLNGGLFYSDNGGDYWINAGSDDWPYSGVACAEIYPENQNIWMACFHERELKGNPGPIGGFGGIMRTKNHGISWEQIANKTDFNQMENLKIYGCRFHPQSHQTMYVLTSDGLFVTKDVLANEVKWDKIKEVEGWVYDMDFVDQTAYISCFQHGEWKLFTQSANGTWSEVKEMTPLLSDLNHLTIEPYGTDLLLLLDKKSGRDELHQFKISQNKTSLITSSLSVIFGAGYTFKVHPTDLNQIYLGNGTRLRQWNVKQNKFISLDPNYHVDVEYVEFDPFDSTTFYMATHGGVYVTHTLGQSWEYQSKGIGIAEVLGMAVAGENSTEIAIGTFHDGSMVYADWEKNGNYDWQTVNGGDALIPLINSDNLAEVYTSNQYVGGGMYFSIDTAKTPINLHRKTKLESAGWSMASVMHPQNKRTIFVNYQHKNSKNQVVADVVRLQIYSKDSIQADVVTDFRESHQLGKYAVYGLYNSPEYPDRLLAYVLDFNAESTNKITHRLYINEECMGPAGLVMTQWKELELPTNNWIGDVCSDPSNHRKFYVSYVSSAYQKTEWGTEQELIYQLKYNASLSSLRQAKDLTRDLAADYAGKYNLVFIKGSKNKLFIGTRSGVFMAEKGFWFRWKEWEKIGIGLPHCPVGGMHYNEMEQILTVGLNGRGVWQINLSE